MQPSEPRLPARPLAFASPSEPIPEPPESGPVSGNPAVTTSLLHALEREHLLRRPLLLTVIDELGAQATFAPAHAMARQLLDRLDRHDVDPTEFVRTVRELRVLVQLLARMGRPPRGALVAAARSGHAA